MEMNNYKKPNWFLCFSCGGAIRKDEVFQTPLSKKYLCSICYESEMKQIEKEITKEVVQSTPYWQYIFNLDKDFCAFCGGYVRKDLAYAVEDNGDLKCLECWINGNGTEELGS